MPGLILKNFRGFRRAVVPLSPGVNFLVGENSTGKTSVLALIDILSSHHFYFTQTLKSDFSDYSNYADAVSAKTPNAEVAIGYYRFSYSKLKRGTIDALCIHFYNNNSRCDIKSISYIANDLLIQANFRRSLVQFYIHKLKNSGDAFPNPLDAANLLVDGRIESVKGEEISSGKYWHKELPMPSPLLSAMNILALEKIRVSEDEPQVQVSPRPLMMTDAKWISPIRAEPQSISTKAFSDYSPEGEHIPEVIRRGFGSNPNKTLTKRLTEAVHNFGDDSHLFEQLSVKEYGASPTDPYEVQVKLGGANHRLSNVGYGVSQSLPVLMEVAASDFDESFIIQQPEVHLHPRAQAAFGDFFFEMSAIRKHQFFIETHSDYLIDRFRFKLLHSKARKKPISQILFFDKDSKGYNTVFRIRLSSKGSLMGELPARYREFFLREELNLLGMR